MAVAMEGAPARRDGGDTADDGEWEVHEADGGVAVAAGGVSGEVVESGEGGERGPEEEALSRRGAYPPQPAGLSAKDGVARVISA